MISHPMEQRDLKHSSWHFGICHCSTFTLKVSAIHWAATLWIKVMVLLNHFHQYYSLFLSVVKGDWRARALSYQTAFKIRIRRQKSANKIRRAQKKINHEEPMMAPSKKWHENSHYSPKKINFNWSTENGYYQIYEKK